MSRIITIIGAVLLCASSANAQTLEEFIATMLNLNGFLCASVVETRPLQVADQLEVTCVEYRGGSGRVRYILNRKTGVAFRAG